MATRIICDGCDKPTATAVKAGLVLRVDYCPACAETHAAYEKEVDALHERLATSWTTELAVLRESFRERLMRLPDDNFEGGPDADPAEDPAAGE